MEIVIFTFKTVCKYLRIIDRQIKVHMWCVARFSTICTIKIFKDIHEGVLLLLLKVTLLYGCFSHFLNCTNGTKSRNAYYQSYHSLKIAFMIGYPFFACWLILLFCRLFKLRHLVKLCQKTSEIFFFDNMRIHHGFSVKLLLFLDCITFTE